LLKNKLDSWIPNTMDISIIES